MNQKNRYKQSAKTKNIEKSLNRHVSLVVVIYIIILAYLIFVVIHSLTRERINYAYAETGEILNEATFSGLIIRDEQVVSSQDSGPVKYFVPEGTKIRKNTYVCAVNQNEEIDDILDEEINKQLSQLSTTMEKDEDDYSILHEKISNYVVDKNQYNLSYGYQIKKTLSNTLTSISQTVYVKDEDVFDSIQEKIAEKEDEKLSNGSYYQMDAGGVISYMIDGMEDISLDTFTVDDLARQPNENDMTERDDVSVGDPLYKIVGNYLFYMAAKIDAVAEKKLEGKSYVTISFPKKNLSIDVQINQLFEQDGDFYVIFQIDRYFDDFFMDRYVDFKIVYDNYSGIKIPNDAVTEKDVYGVPVSAITTEKGTTLVRRINSSSTDSDFESIPIKIYYEDGDTAYINAINKDQLLDIGDQIYYFLDPDAKKSSTDIYAITEKQTLEGVYVVNKGYTDFKRIQTIYEDDTYRIVAENVSYSLAAYDLIATDASKLDEFVTLNE